MAFVLSGVMAVAYFYAHASRSFFPLLNGGELAVCYCFVFFVSGCAGGRRLEFGSTAFKGPMMASPEIEGANLGRELRNPIAILDCEADSDGLSSVKAQ